ncbi:MAG TPA: PilN domain-containing protein [Acidobacteriaceae bacterium]|nr:PilN domain-containing protein [Acidobacteriaceae bacterium]
MRISINLATRPFVELRPLFARLRLAMLGLAVMALALGVWLHFLNRNAQAEQAQMDSLKAQTAAFQMERANNERRMMEPENQAVLSRSQFLNDQFAAKSFSWTSVMMDLERVLPPGVQVTSIDPSISPEHEVTIRLRVSGDRERVVDLVRSLERSQRFLAPRPANETAQTHEAGQAIRVAEMGGPDGVQFEIVSGYNPLPVPESQTAKDEDGTTDADSAAKRGGR